jgi:uncharacterized linocin/CFP29 family protein
MDRNSADLSWTDDQWALVQDTVSREAKRARVGASFLPIYGPLDPTTVAVPELRLGQGNAPGGGQRLLVNSTPNLALTTIASLVYLRTNEVADPELAAALTLFRRAANLIARAEDALIFQGQPGAAVWPNLAPVALRAVGTITAGGLHDGLLPFGHPVGPGGAMGAPIPGAPPRGLVQINAPVAPSLVPAVVQAVTALETAGHFGPYACVLSNELFEEACRPVAASLVMPRDRILPFLDGQLFRSGAVSPHYGLIVSLGGEPIDLVVAADISVKFLQIDTEPRYVFRVSERIVLRPKQLDSVVVLHT